MRRCSMKCPHCHKEIAEELAKMWEEVWAEQRWLDADGDADERNTDDDEKGGEG